MAAYRYISVRGHSKTYAGWREVPKEIWLSFLPGAKIGVLGPNGAGKFKGRTPTARAKSAEIRKLAGERLGVRVLADANPG